MLTGRTYGAEEGQAFGLSQYLVDDGAGLAKGIELAERIAANAPLTNFAVMHVLPRIAESDPASGLAHRIVDGGNRAGQRRRQGAAEGFSGEARQEGAPWLKRCATRKAAIRAAAPGAARPGRRRRSTARPTARSYLRSPHPLDAYPEKLTERLAHWAKAAPDRVFLAQRAADGRGASSPTRQTLARCAAIAQALLDARALGRAADRDPVRQRHRARAARPGRDACRRALCADLACPIR